MNIAIILGRGGSKRIPDKNIRLFAGKPMIAHPIGVAQRSGLFSRTIVSTDSEQIAAVAREYGAETPFMRPASLADDFTTTAPVLIHAIEWLIEQGLTPQYVCCLYATSVFVQESFLRQGLDTLVEQQAASVFSVTTFPSSIYRALMVREDGRLVMVWPQYELTRTNDLPTAYHDAAQFYWLDSKRFLEEKRIYSRDSRPVVVPRHLAQDIDTLEDWDMAERIFLKETR